MLPVHLRLVSRHVASSLWRGDPPYPRDLQVLARRARPTDGRAAPATSTPGASCHRPHHPPTCGAARLPPAQFFDNCLFVGKGKGKAKGGRFVCLLVSTPQGTSSSSGRSPSPAPGRSGRRRRSSTRRHRIGRAVAAAEAGSWSLAPDPAVGRGSTTTTPSPRAARSPPRSKVPQFRSESMRNSSS